MKDYKDQNAWLMFGDCLERMKEIPDGTVDAVISDIPYGIDFSQWDVKHKNKNSALLGKSPAQDQSNLFKSRGKPKNGWSEADKNRPKEFQDFCLSWLGELYRITKPCSPIIIFTGRQFQHRFSVAAEDAGFILKDVIAWDKINAPFRAQSVSKVLSRRGQETKGVEDFRLGNLSPNFEPIVWCFKPYVVGTTITDCFIENRLGCFNSKTQKSNIIKFNSKIDSRLHETEKPEGLLQLLIEMFTVENHTVLDMFMGSGTTGVACKNLNRKFIGVEMGEEYFDIAKNRILGETK